MVVAGEFFKEDIIYPTQQVVYQNTLVSITCLSAVLPEKNIPRWYRDDTPLPTFDLLTTIVFSNVRLLDSGTYTCVGMSPFTGKILVKNSILTVAGM